MILLGKLWEAAWKGERDSQRDEAADSPFSKQGYNPVASGMQLKTTIQSYLWSNSSED